MESKCRFKSKVGGQEGKLGAKCQVRGTKGGRSKVVQGSLETRKSSDEEAWGMVGIHRDSEGPQDSSRMGWSLGERF